MKILNLLKERKNHGIAQFRDYLEDFLLESKAEEVCYVGLKYFVEDFFKKYISTEWKISGIFQLGFPFYAIDNNCGFKNDDWYVFVFTKSEVENIKLGFYNYTVFDNDYIEVPAELLQKYHPSLYEGFFIFNEDYCNMYGDYLNKIDKFILDGILPSNEFDTYQFNLIPEEFFSLKEYLLFPSRYKESSIELLGMPSKNEKLQPLKDVVEFINQKKLKCGETINILTNILPAKYKEETVSAKLENSQHIFQVAVNDIILDDFYISDIDLFCEPRARIIPNIENKKVFVYADYVIRSFWIDPYFLCLYLNSEMVVDYFKIGYEPFDDNSVENIPIIIPPKINERKNEYKTDYAMKYISIENLKGKVILTSHQQDVKKIIDRDLREISACYRNKAYKAAIIMAGSVLELFLIDWLSEFDGKDYFQEDFMVENQYGEQEKDDRLISYIKGVEKRLKNKIPSWSRSNEYAKTIRKSRNYVHAKLEISEKNISKSTCLEVIRCLRYVISDRWNRNNGNNSK